MTPGEWIGTTSGLLGLLVGGAALGRLLVTHGADREQLRQLKEWKDTKSIDRSELDALAAKHVELEERVACAEGDMKDLSKVIGDFRVDLARIPEQLKAQDVVMDLRFKAVEHSINGLKHILENALPVRRAGA